MGHITRRRPAWRPTTRNPLVRLRCSTRSCHQDSLLVLSFLRMSGCRARPAALSCATPRRARRGCRASAPRLALRIAAFAAAVRRMRHQGARSLARDCTRRRRGGGILGHSGGSGSARCSPRWSGGATRRRSPARLPRMPAPMCDSGLPLRAATAPSAAQALLPTATTGRRRPCSFAGTTVRHARKSTVCLESV